ncbi:MAG: ABC transporter permease [Rhizobiaceae bacterium]
MRWGAFLRLACLAALCLFLAEPERFGFVFAPFTRDGQPAIYVQNALLTLALNHIAIVALATSIGSAVAIALAVLVTRPVGADFLPLSRTIANIGQTFPPVAVLALAVPMLGFGTAPTFVALLLYGLLPVFENTLAGLSNLPPDVDEAARASGMTEWQRLLEVDLPLAAPLIVAGVRVSLVIGIGTATIGSTVAASTLGEVIMAGLINDNLAFIVQGALAVALIAILSSEQLMRVERWMIHRRT